MGNPPYSAKFAKHIWDKLNSEVDKGRYIKFPRADAPPNAVRNLTFAKDEGDIKCPLCKAKPHVVVHPCHKCKGLGSIRKYRVLGDYEANRGTATIERMYSESLDGYVDLIKYI